MKKRNSIIVSILAFAFLIGGGGALLANFCKKPTEKAITMDETDFASVGELTSTAQDGSATFDKANLQKLFNLIGDDENTSFAKIQSLAAETQTSADFRLNTYQKENGQDIVVTFGGLQWQVMYLSQTKADEEDKTSTILTLWLTNNTQEAWKGDNTDGNSGNLKAAQGRFYGFYQGGLYSSWSANWGRNYIDSFDGDPNFYPANMYGTSYIRAVTLNNGGQFAIDNTIMSKEYAANSSSVFAKFTMPEVDGSLTKYIVKPVDVKWQEVQSAKDIGVFNYNCSNDAWSNNTPNDGFCSDRTYNELGSYNYVEHIGNDTWKNDYIWLPSAAETGNKGESVGLWKTSTKQRQSYYGKVGSATVSGSKVGGGSDVGFDESGSSKTSYSYSYLRSGNYESATLTVNVFNQAGSGDMYAVTGFCAVRPALHLNLDSATLSAGIDIKPGESTLWADHTEKYKGAGMEGNGSQENPYIIDKAEKLAKMAENVNKGEDCNAYFKLTKDIYLAGWRWTPIGNAEHTFNGNFDGAGHTIYGLKIRAKEADQGLFGRIGSGAIIKSLAINGGTISTNVEGYIGSIVGRMSEGSTVTSCSATGVIVDGINYVGGLVGYCQGTITSVTSVCDVTGQDYVGGVVGFNSGGKISNVAFTGEVEGNNYVGGAVGNSSYSGILTKISTSGKVKGVQYVGGILGYLGSGTLSLSECETIMYGTRNDLGGLIGRMEEGTVQSCVSQSYITATEFTKFIGGMVGYMSGGTLTSCAEFGSIYGDYSTVGCLVGCFEDISDSQITACSFVGETDNKNIKPFIGTGSMDIECCYSACNQIKYISNDPMDRLWTTYFGIVENLRTLPVQRDLYHIASVASSTIDDLAAAFADFEIYKP